MNLPADQELTALINAAGKGDETAEKRLFSLTYDMLRDIAASEIRRWPAGQTQQATGLVHEAFLRFFRSRPREWQCRHHFLDTFARSVQHWLIDAARRRGRLGWAALESDQFEEAPHEFDRLDFEALAQALDELEETHVREAKALRVRYFLGLSLKEIAVGHGISVPTVERWLAFARAWLHRRLVPLA